MPNWWSDAAVNFAGVFLGALLAYAVTVAYGRRETKARRAVLFRALRQELGRYSPEVPRFVRGISNAKDPLVTAALEQVLAAHVLDASKKRDADLLYWLLAITSRVAQLNELARVYNQTFFLASYISEDEAATRERENWHMIYQNIYRVFIQQRDYALALLPDQAGHVGWPEGAIEAVPGPTAKGSTGAN